MRVSPASASPRPASLRRCAARLPGLGSDAARRMPLPLRLRRPPPPPRPPVCWSARNPATGGLVCWDRWAQDNHNSVILARSGAGKSYLAKLEVLRSLYQGVQVAVIDPEDEYQPLADAVGGTTSGWALPGCGSTPSTSAANPTRSPAGRCSAHPRRGPARPAADPAASAALDRAVIAAYATGGITSDPRTRSPARAAARRPRPRPARTRTRPGRRSPPGSPPRSPAASAACSTSHHHPPRRAPGGGRLRDLPDELKARGRCWPWTRSGATSATPPAGGGGWSWSTRPGR